MGWTKREYILEAFDLLGMSSYMYELSAEMLQSALRKLDAMIAGWNSNGIRIGWALPNNPSGSDIDVNTNAPDVANEAIYYNLAIRIAPSYGKILSQDIKNIASEALSNLISQTSVYPEEMALPISMPRGAGSKSWRRIGGAFITPLQDNIDAGSDGKIIFE